LTTPGVRGRAWAALAAIVVLLLALNALNVANSYVGRNFMTSIARRDHHAYVHFALLYVVVFAASTVAGVTQQFVQDRLALFWRDWLTRRLIERYLTAHTFDRVARKDREIDNPDQRIAEDVKTFTSTFLSFVVMATNAVLTTAAFAGVLWSITPALLVTVVLYAALGSGVTLLLGYRLVGLNDMQLRKEADLRYSLIHAREHSRSAEDEAQEGRRVRGRVRRVVRNARALISVTRNVGFFSGGYNYLVQILPVLIVAPRFLRGQIEFGVVTQSAMAFAQLLGAFSIIVAQIQSISAFTAVVRRVGALWNEVHLPPDDVRPEPSGAAPPPVSAPAAP
jgi:putative ATP-binding cassette transporter